MIKRIFIFLVLFLLENKNIVGGLEVIYYQDFTQDLSCQDLFSKYLSMVSGSFYGNCQLQCKRSDNLKQADILSLDMNNFKSQYQIIKFIQYQYSFLGFDIVYITSQQQIFYIYIFDGNDLLYTQQLNEHSASTNIEYNYSLKCAQNTNFVQVSKDIYQLNEILTSTKIQVRIEQKGTSNQNFYGILKLRVWANCVENCDVCLNRKNCKSCLSGFDRYILPSGQKVCDQTYNCNKQNCFSCIKSSPDTQTIRCVKCLPGYSLDIGFNCIPNPGGDCSSQKYQSNGSGCQNYSTQCYIQKQNTYYNWQPCPSQVNLSEYKCLNSQSILIYEHKNYSLYTCGCPINNCIQCPDKGSCSQCQIGFTYDPIKFECKFVACPQYYVRDLETGLCNSICTANCQKCDSNQKCQLCFPNYYIMTLNPTNCALCKIENCSQCSGEGLCQQCKSNFILSPDRTSCNSCKINNCIFCVVNQPNLCQTCLPVDGQTVQCKLNCSIDNCKECQDPPNNKTQCKACNSGYVLDLMTNQCISTQCQVPQCSQCQLYKTNLCNLCNNKYNLDSNFQCTLSANNDFVVQQTVIQNVGYNITLAFQYQIVTDYQNIDRQLNIQIKNYVNQFQISFLQVQEKSINFQLQLSDNCKNKNLIIQMNDPSFVQINNVANPQKEVNLKDYVILSQSQIEQSQQTKQVASGASTSLLIMVILMIVIGNTYVLFSTIDLATFIYFMLFIDVRYPDNVISFCSIFQNFQFAFIPNSIQVYLMDSNYTQPYTPKNFIDNGYDAYFFNGAGQSLTTMAGIIAIYGIIKILSYIPITSIRVYIRSKIKSGWEYCGFFDMVGSVYVYLLISCLLQFNCFQFDESLAFINYTLFSLTLLFTIIYPIMITIFIKKCKNLNDPQIQLQFGSIIGGLVLPETQTETENDQQDSKISQESKQEQKIKHVQLTRQKHLQYKWSRYTNVILYARKIIYMMALLYFYGQVPQEKKVDNIKNGISELLLVIIQITICFLVKDDDSQREEERYNIGWIIVGSASFILTIHIFSVIIDLIKGIYNLVKDFICTLIKSKAEIEKLKQEKLAEEQNKQNKLLRIASQISIDKLRSLKNRLSLIQQSQLDTSSTSIQKHQIKQKKNIIQPKNNQNNNFLVLQNQQENISQSNKNHQKDEENKIQKNKKSSIGQKNLQDHEKTNLQNSFTCCKSINNQTTYRTLSSVPKTINISNNNLLTANSPS
ncbi:hypothetical protein ABPG74_019304 [Tetrahymena malaccensis]